MAGGALRFKTHLGTAHLRRDSDLLWQSKDDQECRINSRTNLDLALAVGPLALTLLLTDHVDLQLL